MDSQTIRTALGELQENPDRKPAWEELRVAVEVQGGDLSVADALNLFRRARQAHEQRGEYEAVAELLSLETDLAANTPSELTLLNEQARVLQQELYDDEGSLVAYLRVLELSPEDPNANNAITDSEDKRPRWQELSQTYLDEASGAPDDVYKSSMLMRAAEMELRFAGDAMNLERVVERLRESLRLDPANERAARMLEITYRRNERWQDLAFVLQRLSQSGPDEAARVRATQRLARVQTNHIGDQTAGAQAYEDVLRLSPGHPEAMGYLSEYYSREERWDDLVGLYERQLEAVDLSNPERIGDMLQVGMLHWRMRQRPNDAEPWFEHIRKLQPANQGMLQFFREYCGQTGDQGRLLGVLQAAHRAMADGPDKKKLSGEIAELAEEQKQAQKAVEQYKSLLRQDPENTEAREKLKELYRQTQGYNALVELLRQELERTDQADTATRLKILREVASVYRQFIKSDTALVSVLNQIVQINENDSEAVRELIGLYEKLGRWRDLLANQQRLAELTENSAEKAELYRAAGRRWLEQFSNVQNAMQAFEALLAVKPGDSEAMTQLEELYKKRRAWPALYELYQARLATAVGSDRLPIMREMAQLAAERLHKGEEAAKLYREILAADPHNTEILDALEKHAERAKDWPLLAEALERRVEIVADDGQRLALLQKLGTVYSEHMGDLGGAVSAWRRVLELSPGHHRALRVLRDAYLQSGDYDGLEELFAAQSDWEGLADVLSNTADRTKDQAAKVELSYRAAAVYVERLNQPDRAFRSYERILATDPGDTRAARALIPLYERDEKWVRLPPLYELIVEKSEDDGEKLEYLRKLVDVCSTRLSDRAGSVQHARRAYEIAPDDDQALALFEEACRVAGSWEPFVEALEARVKRVKKKDKKRSLQLKLAEIYTGVLGRVEDAITSYKALLEADPSDQEAAVALDAILRQEQRRDDLRWLLGLRVENAATDVDQVDLLREWAVLEEEVFDAPEQAARLHRQLLAFAPGDPTALRALPRLLLAAGDAAGAAEVLEAHSDIVEGDERIALEVQLAELYLDRLERPKDALGAATRTLELSDHDPRAIAVLQKLLSVAETKERAAQVLAAEYAAVGDARQESEALVAMLQATRDKGERLSLYARLADVHEQKLDSFNAALDVVLRAVREYPTEVDLWQKAEALAAQSGRYTDLAEAYREALHTELPAGVDLELAERAARLHEERLGDPIGASPYLERVLARDPGNERAFGRLKQILTGAERWGELEELYDRTSAATDDPAAKAEMLAEVALVCEEIIEDAPKATRYYERILEIDPTHESAIAALERLYDQQRRHQDLARLLERRLDTADGDEILQIRLRLGRILLSELHQPGAAVEHIEDVLRERPNDYDARDLAERLLEIGDLKVRAARMLEGVYEARNEVRDLVRVLEIRLEGLEQAGDAAQDGERRELLHRIAMLRDERLRDDAGALDALARYVPLDPMDVDARQRLLDVGRRLGAQARVADVLLLASEKTETASMKGDILMQVARICEEQLGDPARAEGIYLKVLDIDEGDAELVLPASRALERVYIAQDQHEKLAAMLRKQIRLEQDAGLRQELQGRLGSLCESVLDDPNGAIEAWKARLEENPGDPAGLAALDRLYERTERWRDLVQVLDARRERSEDDGERRTLMRRSAEVLATRLSSPADAVEVWQSIVAEFGPDAEGLSALESLFDATQRWEDLADTYQSHLDVIDEPMDRIDLLAKLGDLRRERLNNPSGALEAYRDALTLDTTHGPSRAALEKLLESEDAATRRETAEVLHPIYEADGDSERLLRVLEVEIEAAEDPLARLEGLEKAMRVADALLNDPVRALAYSERAVRAAAGHTELPPWLDELDRLASATGKRGEQVLLLKEIVGEIFDGDVQFAVTMKIANLARDQLGDRQLAREYYKKALEQRPDNRAAMVALEALYEEADDVEALLEILERRVDVSEDDAEKKQLLFRRARLLAGRIDDRPRAISVYESLLDLDLDPQAVEALEGLYAAEQKWNELIELYQRRLDGPPAEVADLHVKIARVAADHLNDAGRAFDEIEAALETDRQHRGAIAELERVLDASQDPEFRGRAAKLLEPIYLVRADYDKVMKTITARLEASEDAEERRELLGRLAQLYEEQKEDYTAALETVAKLLHEDLGDQATVTELERLAKVAGAERRLGEIYASELEAVQGDDPATSRLAQRAGEIFGALGDHDRALSYYRRALAFEPENNALFAAVDDLLQRTDRNEERVALYKSALDYKFDPADRLRLLHTIAALQRDKLGRPDEATETYRAALDVDERDTTALDSLTALYRDRERWDDLAELYTRRADGASSAQAGAQYRLSLARLLKTELSDTERALDQLEEIVRGVPTHQEAITELETLKQVETHRERVVEILRPLYEEVDDWRRVIRLNEDRFDLAVDPTEKVSVLRETAELWERRGGDLDRARRALGVALELDPEDAETRADYERLTEATGAWDDLAEQYEDILREHPDLNSKRDVLSTLARVHDIKRDDPRRALEAYARLRQVDEHDVEVLEKMEQLSILLSDWLVLVDVLTAKSEAVLGDEDRASIWRQIGEARRDMLEDSAGAIQAYERASELDPESAFTLDSLIDLYEQKGDAERLVELYQRRVELTSDNDAELKYSLLVKAAECLENKVSDRPRAIEVLNQALAVRPGDRPVLEALNRLYRAEQMWPELLDSLRLEASSTEAPERRAALRREIGDILAGKLESFEEALEAYGMVLDESPQDDAARAAVRKLGDEHDSLRSTVAGILVPVLRLTERYDELVDVLEMRLTTETDPSHRASTLRSIAEVLDRQLGRPGDALGAMLRALSEQPEANDLHDDIERLAAASDGWGRYADALSDRAQATFEPEQAKQLYARLGRVAEQNLDDSTRAVEAYVRAIEQAGDQPELLEALDRLYVRTGNAEALNDILERRAALVTADSEQADLYYRMAAIQIKDFKDPIRGLASLRSALERIPGHEDATRALEGLTDNRDLFEEAAAILEGVYRSRGQNDRLAALYEKRIGFAETPGERIDMRRNLARVLEEDVGDPSAAQRVIQQGFNDDPADQSLIDEIERLAPITNNWEGAAAALRDAVANKVDLVPDVARDLSLKVARWYKDKVEDSDAAEKALFKALEFDSTSDEVLEQIEELQSAPGRERDLVGTLRRRAKRHDDAEQRQGLYRRAKELADSLNDRELAEAVLRELLDQESANLWALSELTNLREAAEDYEETFDLLVRRVEIGAHEGQNRELRHKAAAIARDRLLDSDKSVQLYEALFDEDAADTGASRALRDLYASLKRHKELGRVLERLVDIAESANERGTLRMELARLHTTDFKDIDGAIDLLKRVLEEEPSRADAVVALSELYEESKRDEDLAALLDSQISAARDRGDVDAELQFQVRLGEVYDARLGDRAKAIATYRAVLERDAQHRGALEALARLYQADKNHVDAASILERLLEMSEEEAAVRLSMEVANEYRVLSDNERAASALERGLAIDPTHAEIRNTLRSLYESSENWDKLAALIAGDADKADNPDERVKLLRKAAQIHASKRRDPAAAAELLRQATEVKPEDRELMLELCDAFSASGRGKEAVAVLEKIVESYGGKRSKELGEIHRRLARAYLADSETQRALEELDKAFRIEPGNVHVLKELGEVSVQLADYKKAQQMFRALLLQKLDKESPITKAEVFMHLGDVHVRLGETQKAIQMLERAIQTDDSLARAKELLAQVKGS